MHSANNPDLRTLQIRFKQKGQIMRVRYLVAGSQRLHRARDSSRITRSTCKAGSSMFNNLAIISLNFTHESVDIIY